MAESSPHPSTTGAPGHIPSLDIDPFSRRFLENPYAFHTTLREAGPVVHLALHDIYALARHEEVNTAFRDHITFCSGRGVGISDFARETPWRPPSLILEADQPLHTRTRTVLARVLSPGTTRSLRATFEKEAEALADRLAQRGTFDAITDLAEAYPLKVFPDAVGLAPEHRENLLVYGSMAFNAFGPRNWLLEAALVAAGPIGAWIATRCQREALSPDGFGAQIHAAADSGEITRVEAELLVRSLLTAGVDTTVNGIGNALAALVAHPQQWALLHADPSLARGAFEEALRYDAAVQTFFRTTTRDVTLAGCQIGEGRKVLLFLAAANRDPRRWPDAETFDIRRSQISGHVAFGAGIHGCVGQMLARLEGELVLAALARRFSRIEAVGAPVRRLNNTLHALASLPVRGVA